MAGRQHRPGEGVTTVRFPRTDFPQDGWLRKATVNGTTGDFYEDAFDFGWFSETQSYRPYEKTIGYGPKRIESFRAFYQTEPQQGWLLKPKVAGTTSDLYEQDTDFGWWSETQSYRPNEQTIRYGPKKIGNKQEFYKTEPQQGWLAKPIISFYEPNSGIGWLEETATWITPKHPARDLDRWDQDDANFDIVNFGSTFDPSLQTWTSPDVRMGVRKPNVVMRPAGLEPVFIGNQDWGLPADRMASRKAEWKWDTVLDLGWLGATVVDPVVTAAAVSQLSNSFRNVRNRSLYLDGDKRPSASGGQAATVFDPSSEPWTIDSQRWVPGLRPPMSWTRSGYFTAVYDVDPALRDWTIQSDIYEKRNRRPNLSDQDPARIYPNLPVVFDPAINSWTIPADRMAFRSRSRVNRDTQTFTDWLWQVTAPDWNTSDARMGAGKPNVVSRQPGLQPVFNANLVDTDLRWPAIQQEVSDRTAPGHKYQRDTNRDQLGPPLPFLQSWDIQTDRTALGHKYQRDTNHDQTGVTLPFQQTWNIPSDRMELRKAIWQWDTAADLGWLNTSLGLFDPAVSSPAFSQLSNSFRNVQNRSLYLDGEKRPSAGGGLFQAPAAPFDPSTQSWSIDSQRRVRGKRPPMSWTRSGYFTGIYDLDPALRDWTIQSGTYRSRNRRPNLSTQTPEWIAPTVSVNFPLGLYQGIAQLQGVRTPARRNLQVQRYASLYDLSWLHDVIPLTDPTPSTTQLRGRRIVGDKPHGQDDWWNSWQG